MVVVVVVGAFDRFLALFVFLCEPLGYYATSDDCLLVFRVMTLVMACRIVTPAFSISFLDSPEVTQTLSAGLIAHVSSLGVPIAFTDGKLLRRVIRTPLFNVLEWHR